MAARPQAADLPDRMMVAALVRSVSPHVDDVLTETGAREQRTRLVPARLALYLSLGSWVWPAASYRAVWLRLVDGLAWAGHAAPPAVPAVSSMVRAVQRLGPEPLQVLFRRLAPSPGGRVDVDTCHTPVTAPCGLGRGARIVTAHAPVTGMLVDVAWAPDSVPEEDLRGRLAVLRAGGVAVDVQTRGRLLDRVTGHCETPLRSTTADGVAQEVYALACVYQIAVTAVCTSRPRV